ncbi:unnamed protein product [Linum trigynum]|uniref:RNase H type-1 domain-containing protein n=1 Tax=Linum trigynum TaxID=586398 RepID=A0AAV2D6R4_9ROSI
MKLIPPSDHHHFFRDSLQDWIEKNLKAEHTGLNFGLICWSLLMTRNDRVFAGKIVTTEGFLQRVQTWITVVRNALDKDRLLHTTNPPARTEVEISWKPPPPEWVTLNTDGSVAQDTCHAVAGGLLRDHTGRSLQAFVMNLRMCSITRAELRGAVEGLQLAWDAGYRHVRLELDSACAIQLLRSPDSSEHHHAAIIDRAIELLQRQWEVEIAHIYREGNKSADYLASRGHHAPLGVHLFPISDPILYNWILYDVQGISKPRVIMNER